MKRLIPFVSALALLLPASAPAAETGIWDRIKAFFSRESASASQPEESLAKEPAPQKPLDPVAEAARHEAAVKESLKTVTTTYPAVLEKGTIFNEEFCARLRKLQAENPEAMKDDNWPMELAKNTERGMLLEQYESAEVRRQMTELPPRGRGRGFGARPVKRTTQAAFAAGGDRAANGAGRVACEGMGPQRAAAV